MAHLEKILKTTFVTESALFLINQAVRDAVRQSFSWEWRELRTKTAKIHRKEITPGKWIDLRKVFVFKGSTSFEEISATVIFEGFEHWTEPYGEDSYDNYGNPLTPEWLRLRVGSSLRQSRPNKVNFKVVNGSTLLYQQPQ